MARWVGGMIKKGTPFVWVRAGLVAVVLVLLTACERKQTADFFDVEGQGYLYEDYADKWLVVNYWATWCAPCIKEIPELNLLSRDHGEKLAVFGVNFDSPLGDEAQRQANKMKIAFPVYLEPPHEQLGIRIPEVLPTTFVFSPGLELKATLVGPQTAEALLAVMGSAD